MRCMVGNRRGFTVLEVLLALAIFVIGMVSVITLFPIAIFTQRRMVDQTVSAMIARAAISTLAANRVAEYLSPPSGGWTGPVQYPGVAGAGTSLYEDMVTAGPPYTPIIRDIDGRFGFDNPEGWQYAWTTWDEDVLDATGVQPARPDADGADGVSARTFNRYAWTANIYGQDVVPILPGSSAYRYRVQVAVFRTYDAQAVTLAPGATAGNDPASGNNGYVEATDASLAAALQRNRGYLRITNPADPGNQIWYRVESVHRHVGPGANMTRIALAEPLRGAAGVITDIEVSENMVFTQDAVIVAEP